MRASTDGDAVVVRGEERIDYDTRPLSCPNQGYILTLFTGHIASQPAL
jgi:hypothetical protein